jgi:hypothetical protein
MTVYESLLATTTGSDIPAIGLPQHTPSYVAVGTLIFAKSQSVFFVIQKCKTSFEFSKIQTVNFF